MVFRYSSRFIRRRTTARSLRIISARTDWTVIQSTTAATSAGAGCSAFFGGISCPLSTLTMSVQVSFNDGSKKSLTAPVSDRNVPFAFAPVWQLAQYFFKKGAIVL